MGEAESDGGGDEKPREKSGTLRGVLLSAVFTFLGGSGKLDNAPAPGSKPAGQHHLPGSRSVSSVASRPPFTRFLDAKESQNCRGPSQTPRTRNPL